MPSRIANVTKLPRVVELVRVSSEGQVLDKTDQMQRRALDALRKNRPGILLRRIEALGVSGTGGFSAREDLRELAELSQAKAYDELRVYALDRLTRSPDQRDRAAIYGMVADAEAIIVDCSGTIIDPSEEDGGSEINWLLQTLFAARERTKFLRRTAAGRLRKAEDGLLIMGKPPYGRRFNDSTATWELVPEQVVIYRRIIAECLAGRSTREIARGLNLDRVPCVKAAKKGHQPRWQHSSIKRLLKAASIVGEYKVCGHTTEIPPITTREEWGRVLVTLRTNRSSQSGPKPVMPALLRKKLKCAACGRTVVTLSDGKGATPRYACARPHERAVPCPDRRSIRVPDADAAVRAALLDVLTNSEALKKAIRLQHENEPKEEPIDAEAIEQDLKKLEARQARTIRLMNEDLLTEAAGREELAIIKEERTRAERRRQRVGVAARSISPAPSEKALKAAAREMGAALREASMERMVELLNILCPPTEPYGISLTRSGIVITGRLPVASGELAHDRRRCDRRPRPSPGRPSRLPGRGPRPCRRR